MCVHWLRRRAAADEARRFTHAWRRRRRRRRRRRSQNGETALIWAAERGHADCVRLLLDAGADKNVKTEVRARAGVCGAGCGELDASGDGVDGMFPEQVCDLHMSFFHFRAFWSFCFLCVFLVMRTATASVEITWCICGFACGRYCRGQWQ